MTARSKVYFILAGLVCALAAVLFATQAQPAALNSPLALRQGQLRQVERDLEFTMFTARPVDLAQLDPRPDLADGRSRYACLEMTAEGEGDELPGARLCLGPDTDSIGITATGQGPGDPGRGEESSPAGVTASEPAGTTARVALGDVSLPAARYRFRFVTSDGSCGSRADDDCVDELPGAGEDEAWFNLRTPALVRCEGAQGQHVRHGSRDSRQVALTFDDGPGASTEEILDILRGKGVDATFYLLGEMVPLDEDLVKRIVRQGSEVANHSTHHAQLPDAADLDETNRRIEDATGVRPCGFRPPYGLVDGGLAARAADAGLDTVLWDVDTEDWTDGASVDAIVAGARANTQNGSIILMHDGGDNRRDKTIAALPRIIDELRADGYSFVTVSELLGNKITYRPLGKP